MSETNKKYDVVILTYRSKDTISDSIEMLLKQSIKPTKIIIMNTEENLFYKNIVDKERFDKLIKSEGVEVHHIDISEFDHGKTRNDALKYAVSDYVLYMTDDAVPCDTKFCENLLLGFSDNVAIVTARQVAKNDSKLKEKYVREFNYKDFDIVKDKDTEKLYGIKNYFCSNASTMYDRKIFEKLGGFPEFLLLNEDTLYAYKAINNGYKMAYKADAMVYHSHNLSYKEQYMRNFAIGVSHKLNTEIFDKLKTEGEGKKLYFYVIGKLLKRLHFIDAIDFTIECVYRYLGYKKGRKS